MKYIDELVVRYPSLSVCKEQIEKADTRRGAAGQSGRRAETSLWGDDQSKRKADFDGNSFESRRKA